MPAGPSCFLRHAKRQQACDDHKYWLNDARGIPVKKVCCYCEEDAKQGYRPEIFENGSYDADEPIEPDE